MHRRRSRAVNEQDQRELTAFRTGQEVKLLGNKGVDYVDWVEYQRTRSQGSKPPKGYRVPEEWQPGTESKLIARASKLLSGPPPWHRALKYEYPSRVQLD